MRDHPQVKAIKGFRLVQAEKEPMLAPADPRLSAEVNSALQ